MIMIYADKKKKAFSLVFCLLFFNSLLFTAQTRINEGMWRGVLKLDLKNHIDLPFTFNVFYADGQPTITIFNAEENIVIDEIESKGDSIFFKMPVFDSEFKLRLFPSMMQGSWINHSRKDKNIIPFEAIFGQTQRFKIGSLARNNFDGRWECTFSPGTKDSSKAIGVFKQKQQIVTGTFLTETGDYRYLDGAVDGNNLFLSCFDGAHAFLFQGTIDEKNFVTGTFYSGAHWQEKWVAKRNDKFELRDPFSLSKIVKKEPLELSFPNVDGKKISITDPKYKDKVVVVQIMGSWCPNCMDETAYLTDVYNRYQKKGVEIIALAYERTDNFDKAKANVQRLINKYGSEYEFLITGLTGTEGAKKSMPWLSTISAFPTTIYLNKKHEIVKVYTGYNGPATGGAYIKMKEGTENLLNDLLK
jgi:thiol-disulfide isomerase/thioredoxin